MSVIASNKAFRFLLLALIAAALIVPAAVAQDDVTVTYAADEPVVIAVAAGITGEGIAPLGIDIVRGVELANEARPTVTVGDVEFEVILQVEDEGCSAEGGQAVANRLAADPKIAGVVGHMCSSSCFAGAPIYDAADFTTISPSCTNPDLSTQGFTSFNRAAPTDATQGRLSADFIYNYLGVRTIATIHDGSPYGEGLVNFVAENFIALGGAVVAQDAVTVGETDFRALLEEIAAAGPELIYFGGFPAEAARLAQQRADVGMADVLFMGADGIQGTEVVEQAGAAAEGMIASAPVPSGEAYEEFLAEYEAAYNELPPAPFHANAWDGYNILLDAVEAVGTVDGEGNLVISRAAIREYVRTLTDYVGLIGPMANDGNGELVTQGGYTFFIVTDGVFTPVQGYAFGGAEAEPEATEAGS